MMYLIHRPSVLRHNQIMNTKKAVLAGAIILLAVLQLVPVDLSNPPVEQDVGAPAPVAEVLRRACYDCHSNQTRWPWYSRVAPVSWWIKHHVDEGREHLNFSEWNRLSTEDRSEALEETWEEVEEGKMPLSSYLPMHPDARLTPQDLQLLKDWAGSRSHAED